MGDRKNPIKFGPEWLRNLARDSPSDSNDPGASGEGPRSAPDECRQLVERMREGRLLRLQQRQDRHLEQQRQRLGQHQHQQHQQQQQQPQQHQQQQQQQNAQNTTKVQLAKLRYGREEMLALYDKSLEPPADLRSFELLYSPRGKPPIALSSTSFEDDSRGENMRGPPLTTPPTPNFGISRFQGIPERSRTRSYTTFLLRQNSGPRYIRPVLNPPHHGDRESDNAYGETASSAPNRSWNSGHTSNQMHRITGDGNEWTPPKAFKRWAGPPTSWRRPQSSRDEESEWRSDGRPRTTDESTRPQARWTEREKGDRTQKERPQSWHTNKRNMTPDSEDPLPEWAVDNADTYQGTFDSSGAFHGYSSDDSNIPKTPTEGNFVLSRSQTHGNFSRSKSVEEGSDEWWMSEKVKKLSNNKFDATDIKFKKQTSLPAANEANDTPSDDHMFLKESLTEEPENDDSESMRKGAIKKVVTFDTKNLVIKELNSKPTSMLGHSQAEDTEATEADLKFKTPVPTGCKPHLRRLARLIQNEATSSQVPGGRSNNVITDLEEKDMLQEEQIVKTIPSPTFVSGPSLPPNHLQNSTVNSLASNSTGPAFPILSPTSSGPTYFESSHARRVMTDMLNPLPPPNLALRMPYPGSQSIGFPVPTPRFSGVLPTSRHPVFTPRPQPEDQNTGRNLLYLVQGNNTNIVPKNDIPSQLATGTPPMYPTSNVHMMSNQNFGQSGFSPMQYESYSPPSTPPPLPLPTQSFDMWYYQDPEKNIQGPFSPLDMANWYRAGYFDSNILVREASETQLKPLGCYGPVPPFMISLGFRPTFDPIKTETGYVNRTIPFEEQVDSLWGQQSPSANRNWMQTSMEPRYNTHYWNSEPVAMPRKTLPETKDMKTEDQILAQIRAKNDIEGEEEVASIKLIKALRNFKPVDEPYSDIARQKLAVLFRPDVYANKQPEPVADTSPNFNCTSNLDDIEKLIQKESLTNMASGNDLKIGKKAPSELVNSINNTNNTVTPESIPQKSPDPTTMSNTKSALKNPSNKNVQESKQQKSLKSENQDQTKTEKNVENKDNNASKSKNKVNKTKDKKDEDNAKLEKKIEESIPVKTKKDEKNKKDAEKEKKSQSSGVTTTNMKGQDKGVIKKKTEETKIWQEIDKKTPKKESDSTEDNKTLSNFKSSVALDKEVSYAPKTTPIVETFKKIPWSSEEPNAVNQDENDGLTLTQIQRMERIRKMQEQQIVQFVAQQQQTAFDKELAALGWCQAKSQNLNSPGLNLANIQAETRKQAAAASASPPEDLAAAGLVAPALPWANVPNGVAVGFWDTEQQNQLLLKNNNNNDKSKASNKPIDSTKGKKKASAPATKTKKEIAAIQEFEAWCTTTLTAWNTDVDVPTFVSFLKDIESPYEVKDYIKYYLGDTKDSSDFSRQFLEKRSKMLRVGTTTPVDDLCSPALAINPKPTLNLDNQENKGKGKKSKKNKMQKIDSRILGFSVTAAQDRINVGDIDTV